MEHLGWQPQRDCLFLEAVSCGLLGEPWSLERVLSRRFWTPGLLQRDVRTPLRTLMDTAGSHSQRWTPTSTLDLVCQGAPLGLCVLLWPGRCGAPTVRRVQTLSRTTEERGCPGFSDPNAACSALTNCDAKRRGRLQNRLLDWRLHHQVLLSFLTSLGCGVGHALILRKGRQWRVVTLSSAARTLWRHLVDAAGTHSQRWMPRCTPSSVWQALLTCEVVPTLAEVLRAWCWLSLVLTLLSPGVLPLAIFRAPQFWWDLRAFCLSQRTWVCSLISRFSMFSCCYVMFALVFLFFIFFPGCLLIHPGSAINQMISVLETYPPHGDAFPDLLDCSVGCALILGKGWHWRVVTLLSSARTLLRLLVDTARTHTRAPFGLHVSLWPGRCGVSMDQSLQNSTKRNGERGCPGAHQVQMFPDGVQLQLDQHSPGLSPHQLA
eukprot:XP_025010659.1 uncharacterized protein LOC107049815 isoform X3 [Gallus gallus]